MSELAVLVVISIELAVIAGALLRIMDKVAPR